MNNSINFFKINPAPEGTDENLILDGLIEILDPEDDKLVATQDWNGQDVMFVFLPEYKVSKLVEHFKKYGVLATHRNVTEDILMARVKSEDFEKVFEEETYRNLLTNFLKSNLTPDMILDKISEQGISSITELDKAILENN